MKVLLLNPYIDAEHAFVTELRSVSGWAILCPADAHEATQMLALQGDQLELAIIHREQGGFDFLSQLKAHPRLRDLAVIITSQDWNDGDFARHQATDQGANAYLKWPHTSKDLVELSRAIFGEAGPARSQPSMEIPSAATGLLLEDASSLLGAGVPNDSLAISLDAPPLDLSKLTGSQASLSDALPATPAFDDGSIELSSSDDVGLVLSLSDDPAISVSTPVSDSAPPPSALDVEIREPTSLDLSLDAALESSLDSSLSSSQEPSLDHEAPVSIAAEAPPESYASLSQAHAPDHQAEQEMPYLFQRGAGRPLAEPGIFYPQPLGDAVVPGGAAHAPDVDTLKKYLMLREQDVSVLTSQLRAVRAQLSETEKALRDERGRATDLGHTVQEQKRRIDDFERDKGSMAASYQAEIDELKFQGKARIDKAKLLEAQVREAADEMERIKERVRVDIRKIRVREKELENRLEIMKKDSEALIGARESKIVELKRKLDVLEFNMDLLQDQNSKEKEVSTKLRERLTKAAQVVRVAAALADDQEAS